MPLNESNVVPRARRLLVYTIDAANFSDKMDIIFVAEMIEKFAKFVDKFKDVSGERSRLSPGFNRVKSNTQLVAFQKAKKRRMHSTV